MSDRPQRQSKPTKKVIEAQATAKAVAQRKPRQAKNPAPPPVAPPAPMNNEDRVPMEALIAPPDMSDFRGLNLDLSTVPKSKDPKYQPGFNSYDHPFWEQFETPTDDTTRLYMDATDKLADIIPATFLLVPDIPDSFGVANSELKKEFQKPIVQIPLNSKLLNGDYHTEQSKSDDNISASIKFFTNNLPSFKKYKASDDISWVVKSHRLLVAEMLQYYANKDAPKVSTIKTRFNAITRIFRIAFQTKKYQLYEKYSAIVIFLGMHFDLDEHNNELSDLEKTKFAPFNEILDIRSKLEQQFAMMKDLLTVKAYDHNQDLLLASLYSLIPPLRGEIKGLKFTTTAHTSGDWLVMKPDGDVLMDLNEVKKRHSEITFNINKEAPDLARIIKQSYDLYPREFVFTKYKKYPNVSLKASSKSLDDRIVKIFAKTGKRVGVNSLRSSYVSYRNSEAIKHGKQLSYKEKDVIAHRMRTSVKYLDEAYLKIFKTDYAQTSEVSIEPADPVDESTPYQKQLTRNQKYYQENKDKVLEKQKAYKDSKTPFEKSRAKQLYYLNSDAEYYKKMKPATQEKYKFKKENGRWV